MQEFTINNDLHCTGVYAIRCIQNNKYYIGSSGGVINRYKQHLSLLKRGLHHCKALQADYNNGCDFEISIVHKIQPGTDPDLFIVIEYLTMIELYKSGMILYNSETTRNKPPLEFFNNSIMGYLEKCFKVGFDARYIESKKRL